jgi:hypothetical protein
MAPFAMPQFAAVWAVALGVQVGFHLPFHHDFLQGLKQRFALGHRESQGLGGQLFPFNTRQFTDGFLPIVGDGDHLNRYFHGT